MGGGLIDDDNAVDVISLVWVVFRVSVIILISLLLFLGIFLGYLTIPLLILMVFVLIYALFSFVTHWRKIAYERKRNARKR